MSFPKAVEHSESTGKFVFLSESCAPIVALDACYSALFPASPRDGSCSDSVIE